MPGCTRIGCWMAAALLSATTLGSLAQGATLFVYPDGTGPYPTIQAAIDAAAPGDTVGLLQGTYTGPGNTNLDFHGKAITVYGYSGYVPNGPEVIIVGPAFYFHSGETPDARVQNIEFRGDGSGASAIRCGNSNPTIEFCVFTGGAAGASAIYSGNCNPTIRYCTFTGNQSTSGGGAITVAAGHPTIADCTFENNTAAGVGGAIYCLTEYWGDISPAISRCTFIGNSADMGGAIYFENGYFGRPSLSIADCTFTGNSATKGGAICADDYWSDWYEISVTGCSFSGNSAAQAAAIYVRGESVTLSRCTLTGNTSGASGSAIDMVGETLTVSDSTILNTSGTGLRAAFMNMVATISNCTISGNVADSALGGGIYIEGSLVTISHCRVSGNSAHVGGGIFCRSGQTTISSCRIQNNSAGRGAGLYGGGTISNCVITGNTTPNLGGGIYGGGLITGCTIADNTALGGAGVHGGGTLRNTILWNNQGGHLSYPAGGQAPVATYCLVQGGYPGSGNIDTDPRLTPDYHLFEGSPCVDAGDPAYVPAAGETDIDGQARVVAARTDIGADELSYACDINNDGLVDVVDLLMLMDAFGSYDGGPNYDPACDFNGDGYVDVIDLLTLAANFGR